MKARQIIKAVAEKHKLQPRDLLGRDRFSHFVAARREAARALKSLGYSYTRIGKALNRNHDTAFYYCSDRLVAKKSQYYRARRLNGCAS